MVAREYKGYLIDLDGTMYNGNEKIEEAAAFVENLRKANKPFLFLTNNSTTSPEDVSKKLKTVSDVQAYSNEIFTSTKATISYLEKEQAEKIFVIGEDGLKKGLKNSGFQLTNIEADHVVVGLDREVTYQKLEEATLLIRAGARFVGTNPDSNIPTGKGLVPGNGSLLAFLQKATGVEPMIIGKPQATMMDAALEELNLAKDEVLMVGDNYTTDIQAGIQNSIDTLLVLTGFTHEQDVPNLPVAPTFVIDTLADWTIV